MTDELAVLMLLGVPLLVAMASARVLKRDSSLLYSLPVIGLISSGLLFGLAYITEGPRATDFFVILFPLYTLLCIGICGFFCTGIILWRHTLGRKNPSRLNSECDPLCLKCGYNLRGLQSDKCPECGELKTGTATNAHKP